MIVKSVNINEDGSGTINFEKGIILNFHKAPEEVTGLNGLDIWPGYDIILGEFKIASRLFPEEDFIEFVERDKFIKAVNLYKD